MYTMLLPPIFPTASTLRGEKGDWQKVTRSASLIRGEPELKFPSLQFNTLTTTPNWPYDQQHSNIEIYNFEGNCSGVLCLVFIVELIREASIHFKTPPSI